MRPTSNHKSEVVTGKSDLFVRLRAAPNESQAKGWALTIAAERWLTQRSTVERVILTTEFGLDPLLRC